MIINCLMRCTILNVLALAIACSPLGVNAQGSGILVPYREGAKWGYSTTTGKVVIAPRWDAALVFTQGRGIVKIKNANGTFITCIVNSKGEYIIPPSRN